MERQAAIGDAPDAAAIETIARDTIARLPAASPSALSAA